MAARDDTEDARPAYSRRKLFDDPRPLRLGQGGAVRDIPAQGDSCRDLVDILSAGTGTAAVGARNLGYTDAKLVVDPYHGSTAP